MHKWYYRILSNIENAYSGKFKVEATNSILPILTQQHAGKVWSAQKNKQKTIFEIHTHSMHSSVAVLGMDTTTVPHKMHNLKQKVISLIPSSFPTPLFWPQTARDSKLELRKVWEWGWKVMVSSKTTLCSTTINNSENPACDLTTMQPFAARLIWPKTTYNIWTELLLTS